MSRTSGVLAAMKAVPGGGRNTPAPQSGGWGSINQVAANAMYGNPYQNSYGPFLPRPSGSFTDGAFGPMSPDPAGPRRRAGLPGGIPGSPLVAVPRRLEPPHPARHRRPQARLLRPAVHPEQQVQRRPRLHRDPQRGNPRPRMVDRAHHQGSQGVPGRPQGHEGLRGTRRRGDPVLPAPRPGLLVVQHVPRRAARRDLRLRRAVADLPAQVREGLGRGLLGSDLDSMRLVSGPTIRPLLDMHGGKPRPPAPAYQQYLYGVPRSDYQTVITGTDIDDYGLTGAEVNRLPRRRDAVRRRWYPAANPPTGSPRSSGRCCRSSPGCRSRSSSSTTSPKAPSPRFTSRLATRT